jgi:hypothetical protein
MGKPFEVTYSPATWNTPAGGVATNWSAPYGGINVQSPPNLISPADTPDMNNFMFRNHELRTRPNFRTYLPSPDGNPFLGVGSFLSKALVWHTFAFTVNGLYQLKPDITGILSSGGNPWTLVGGPQLSPTSYVRWRVFQSILYYSSNNGHLSAWDGVALAPITDVAFLGAGVAGKPPATTVLIGAQYLGELDNHLMLASTSEITVTSGVSGSPNTFAQRVRWSNSGFNPILSGVFGNNLGAGATFDPTVNVNAGQVDFLDVPDIITGILFIGRTGFILRQNGITEVSPTGNGTVPFDFNHMWASEQGIGNLYTAGVAQYGDTGVFISTEDIYKLSSSAINPIGRGARDAIMSDLASTFSTPTAIIAPALSLGFVYLTYQLYIALPNGNTRVYVLSLEDNNWASWTLSGVSVGIPSKCWIGDSAIVTTSQQVVVPAAKTKTTGGGGGGVAGGGNIGGSGIGKKGFQTY